MWSRWYHDTWQSMPAEYRSEGGGVISDEKYREIGDTIVRLVRIGPDDSVLDLGCSIGGITYQLALRCQRVTGVDFVADSLDFAHEHYSAPNVEYIEADISTFATDELFDCVVINNVVHMLDSWSVARRTLNNAWQRLKPGGRLYLGEVPDVRKMWRFARSGHGFRCYAHRLLPGWAFPLATRLSGRQVNKMLWFNREKIARMLSCPIDRVAACDDADSLLNPIERTHFVATKD